MSKQRQNQKLKELQKRDTPIVYSNLSISSMGKLEERKSSLDKRIVEGYGVIWGQKNDYGEIFVKGCCAKSISDLGPGSGSNYEIKFRDRHGKSCSLFAEIVEDEIGLYFKTKPLDDVQWANDLLTQIRSGTINNFSIGFKHCWDKIEWDDENDAMINIEIRLFEISAVDIPSDTATYAVRSAEEIEFLNDDIEDFVTSLPKSKQLEARKIFTRCMTLANEEPETRNENPLDKSKPQKTGIDYASLRTELKLF